MRNAIIVHGKPSKEEYYDPQFPSPSNYHWIPWLQKQLLINEIETYTPEMFHAYSPDYPTWKKEFERYEVTPDTILVGHSCGGGFLIRWLSENIDISVGKVVLVAPWLDPDREETTDFFNFEIDPELLKRTKSFTVFYATEDDKSILKTIEIIQNKISDAQFKIFDGYGHFTQNDMKTSEFPELLEAVL